MDRDNKRPRSPTGTDTDPQPPKARRLAGTDAAAAAPAPAAAPGAASTNAPAVSPCDTPGERKTNDAMLPPVEAASPTGEDVPALASASNGASTSAGAGQGATAGAAAGAHAPSRAELPAATAAFSSAANAVAAVNNAANGAVNGAVNDADNDAITDAEYVAAQAALDAVVKQVIASSGFAPHNAVTQDQLDEAMRVLHAATQAGYQAIDAGRAANEALWDGVELDVPDMQVSTAGAPRAGHHSDLRYTINIDDCDWTAGTRVDPTTNALYITSFVESAWDAAGRAVVGEMRRQLGAFCAASGGLFVLQ